MADLELHQAIDTLLAIINKDCLDNQDFKVILSKSKDKSYNKTILSPYVDEEVVHLKLVKSTETQHFTQNYHLLNIKTELLSLLSNNFFFLDYNGADSSFYIKQSKKGKVSTGRKKRALEANLIPNHNRSKEYHISAEAPFLSKLGITNQEGKVRAKAQRKYRQINRFIEIIDHLVHTNEISTIVDMGAGKGYLTFSMYAFFKNKYPDRSIKVIGYDIRQDLVDKSNETSSACGYDGLSFVQGNIGSIDLQSADLLVALHACDIASDMAIAQGIQSNVDFMVLSPCCHKQIRNEITKSNAIIKHGIYLERTAEMITDTIRALLLESQGYSTSIFEYISSEHTAKNTMITAKKSKPKPKALEEVKHIKAQYGISHHYLESLLD